MKSVTQGFCVRASPAARLRLFIYPEDLFPTLRNTYVHGYSLQLIFKSKNSGYSLNIHKQRLHDLNMVHPPNGALGRGEEE